MNLKKTDPAYEWMGYAEAADYLGQSQRQVRRWVQQEKIPHTKLGLKVLFTKDQLDFFVEQQTHTPDRDTTRHGIGESAHYFGVSAARVRSWVDAGLLVPDDPSGATRFSLSALGSFMRSHPELL